MTRRTHPFLSKLPRRCLSPRRMLGGMPSPPSPPATPRRSRSRPPPAIRVVAAERRELVETLSVNGTVVARDEAAAGTDLNGLTVIALNADIGDLVKKGDVLAVLDRSMLDTQLAQMQATPRPGGGQHRPDATPRSATPRIGVRQADEALERADRPAEEGRRHQAATRQCRERRRQRAGESSIRRRRRSPPPRPSSASSTRRSTTCACRSPRPRCARRPTAWCWRATATLGGIVSADRRSAVPHRHRRRIRACRRRRRNRAAAAGSAACVRRSCCRR